MDANRFLEALPAHEDYLVQNFPWILANNENYAILECITKDRHLVLCFDGTGMFRYSLLKEDEFRGRLIGNVNDPLPDDLKNYLADIRKEMQSTARNP